MRRSIAPFCLDNSPTFCFIELDEVDSTNNFLKHYAPPGPQRVTLVTAEFQSLGRGAGSNSWESARGQNLLLSLLYFPQRITASGGFALSEALAMGVCAALEEYAEGFSIKWPNDIYHGDGKMAGLLIENDLLGKRISRSILGVGLNVNQTTFVSDAPNPVSMAQVLGRELLRREVLERVTDNVLHFLRQAEADPETLHKAYLKKLYRRNKWASYADAHGTFRAKLTDVRPSGHLVLEDEAGAERVYAFKEIQFIP